MQTIQATTSVGKFGNERLPLGEKAVATVETDNSQPTRVRAEVEGRFRRMMEAHDLVRARLLGSSHGSVYSTAGD